MTAATVVMKPLLGKLTTLLGDEYKKLTGVRKQSAFLRDELSAMQALLEKMELMDKLDPSAKNWRDHVREMSYDMENCIDDFMHEIDGADAKTGFVKKMAKRLRRLGRRHQIANRIEELKVLVVEANSLGSKFATKPTLEEMRGILNLSYMHLPIRLRPCFLYLGMYPEDREIMRNDLVRQWIAEGLVCSSHGVDLEDVAKSYFNELINKSLIQPASTKYGEIVSCRVHDMLLDLILSKSTEDNFISVAYNSEDMARLHSCEYKVRRLSLQTSVGGATSEALASSMSQVRSFAWLGQCKYTPHLSQYKYLRVLLFEFPDQVDTIVDLTVIGHLFLLRYLKAFAVHSKLVLPKEIQGLVHLETLELLCGSTQNIPSDITHLANLFHLTLPLGTVLPKGIQNMNSLRTLRCSGMADCSLEDIKCLGKLTNLIELILFTFRVHKFLTLEDVDALVSSIGMLRDLKLLVLDCTTESDGSNSPLYTLHDPPPFLEILDLKNWNLNRVPRWIGELCRLRILGLHLSQLSSFDVRVLGELPSLVEAELCGLYVTQDEVVISTGLFPVLEYVRFWSNEQDVTAYLSFEAGAMPKLQRLTLGFGWKEWMGASPVGMECLPCLQEIEVHLQESRAESSKNVDDVLADVESAFKSTTSVHPRHPSVKVMDW